MWQILGRLHVHFDAGKEPDLLEILSSLLLEILRCVDFVNTRFVSQGNAGRPILDGLLVGLDRIVENAIANDDTSNYYINGYKRFVGPVRCSPHSWQYPIVQVCRNVFETWEIIYHSLESVFRKGCRVYEDSFLWILAFNEGVRMATRALRTPPNIWEFSNLLTRWDRAEKISR